MIQHLGSIKMLVKYPVILRVDNVCTIFMANNITTTYPTKHVDIWCKYVNRYIEDGIVKIFFKSANNNSNISTKNFKC